MRTNRSIPLPDETPVEMVEIDGIRVRADDKAGQERARAASKQRAADEERRAAAVQPVTVEDPEPEPKTRKAAANKTRKQSAARK